VLRSAARMSEGSGFLVGATDASVRVSRIMIVRSLAKEKTSQLLQHLDHGCRDYKVLLVIGLVHGHWGLSG
jgi:hypothetical protein